MTDQIPTSSLDAISRQPRLSDQVARGLVETIVARRLRPGDPLPAERELSAQFGVSRTVIREAVRSLDARGLLDVRAGSRIRVAAVTPAAVHDALRHYLRSQGTPPGPVAEVRAALLRAGAELAARHGPSGPQLAALEAAARAMRAAGDDRGAAARAQTAFGEAVLAASGNDLLAVLDQALLPASDPAGSELPADALDAAVDAICRGDAEAAGRAVAH
jgi:GntR family transcriptional repressor for pyruvate dehydrogenase complex